MMIRLTILVTLMAASSFVASESAVECESFEYRLGRCYLPVGVEAMIYPGCPFRIVRGDDRIVSGSVESAFTGISWTPILPDSVTDALDDSCRIFIEPARVDSSSSIRLGAVSEALARQLDNITGDSAGTGNPLTLSTLSPYDDVQRLLTGDSLDIVLSYRHPAGECSSVGRATHSAAWVAAMLPNLSRPLNRDGLLTTALYYRFNPVLLDYLFDGDSAAPVNMWNDSPGTPRPYPSDTDGSGKLLRQLPRDEPVRVAVGAPDLRRLAEYFGDVLARRRFDVEFVGDYAEADLWLGWVAAPVGRDSEVLTAAFEMLSRSRPANSAQSEAMTLFGDYLEQLERLSDSTKAAGLLRLARQTITHDLGAFSLFRPRLHMVWDWPVVGAGFNDAGWLRIDSVRVLRLPEPVTTEVGE